MSKTILIGSSNVYRPWDELKDEEKAEYKLQRCTKMASFKAMMTMIEDGSKVIISVIENFVCDAALESTVAEEMEQAVTESLRDFVEVIRETATRLPGAKFVVVEPTQRPGIPWYNESFGSFKAEYSKRLGELGLINLSIIKYDDLPSQIFDTPGIHIVPGMALQFLRAVMYFAEKIFEATTVDLVDEERMETQDGTGTSLAAQPTMSLGTEKTTEEKLMEVMADMEKRRSNDDLVFARIREELDFLANSKKEDRVVVTGMTSNIVKPSDPVEARKWIRTIVENTFDYIVPEASGHIQFVSPNRSATGDIPMCEVKMKEKEWAQKIRKEYGRKRKEGTDFGRLFLANSVTQATRVRLEILKAIAKRCSSPDEDMFVQGFTTRPILQVKRKNGGGQAALTFVDAVARYGSRVREVDLSLAYERAGMTFVGQMRQNFVVLSDKGVRKGGRNERGGRAAGPPVLSGGNKRPLDLGSKTDNQAKRQQNGNGSGRGRGGSTPGRGKKNV